MESDSLAEDSWLISGNPFDVVGAKASGMKAVWVRRNEEQLFDDWEFKPDLLVHPLNELSVQNIN